MASISSMNTMAGASLRASPNRSLTREAPTPTNISTKLDPVTDRNGTSASPATAPSQQCLARPRRTGHEHTSRSDGPGAPVAVRLSQEVHDLGDLPLDPLVAGHVLEAGLWSLAVEDLGSGSADAHQPTQLAPGATAHEDEQAEEKQEGRE